MKERDKKIRRLKEENEFLEEASTFFAVSPSKVSKKQRLTFIAMKMEDGKIKGKISFYCKVLDVSRQAFHNFLNSKDKPWKYEVLANAMCAICEEDEYNDTYGRIRMYQALQLKQPEGVKVPGERTIYRVMKEIGFNHKPKRKPNGITKADREDRKSFNKADAFTELSFVEVTNILFIKRLVQKILSNNKMLYF